MVLIMKSTLKILSYPFVGIYFIVLLIYKFFKYALIGFMYIPYGNIELFKGIIKGFLYFSYFIFSIFKYAFVGLILPIKLLSKPKKVKKKTEKAQYFTVNVTPKKTKEAVTPATKTSSVKPVKVESDDLLKFVSNKNKDYKLKQESKLAKIEEKKKAKEEKKKRKTKDKEAYINKNVDLGKVKIDKKKKVVFAGIVNKIRNNNFAKARRNRKDINRQALLIDFEGKDAIKSDKKQLYQYVAKAPDGRIIKDYFNAYSKVEVHSYLLSEGYEVYSIKTNGLIRLLHSGNNTNRTRFKNKDLIFFLTQLSTYIKAGIPLVEALRIISRQYKKKTYQKIFRSVIYELTIGESFSIAMEKQNTAFPKLLINMVKTAEMTGSLPEVLDDMANYYTEAEATRKQMITAMTYPAIVFTVAIGVMIFVMVYVVPKFVEIYDTMETDVPTITKVILGLSFILKHYWYLVVLGIALLIILFVVLYKKNRGFKTICQYGIMHLPVIGNVIIYNEVTMFTKTFSSLLAHNVPITDSMEILNKITNNEIFKMLILDTITNLARGGKISDAFKDQWAFPVPAYEMIVTGEATGELSEMMHKVSLYYQDLHKNAVTRIKAFIEPALTIFLTLGVGIILLAIIIPMFNMYSAVQDM